MYSNFWMRMAVPACAAGLSFCLFFGRYDSAGIFGCLYLIASGIDRQVGLDRIKNKTTPRGP
jgi:hypothetical protein